MRSRPVYPHSLCSIQEIARPENFRIHASECLCHDSYVWYTSYGFTSYNTHLFMNNYERKHIKDDMFNMRVFYTLAVWYAICSVYIHIHIHIHTHTHIYKNCEPFLWPVTSPHHITKKICTTYACVKWPCK